LTSDIEYDDVYSVLQAFKPFLKSIDMRTIAVRNQSGEDWENFITSMAISEKSVDEVKKEQSKLPKIRTDKIALFHFPLPFDYSVFEGFAKGEIRSRWLTIITAYHEFGS
jgi:hypothetical protein